MGRSVKAREEKPAERPGVTIALAAVFLLLVAAIFQPLLGFGFLGLDDPRYVTSNAHVRSGLSLDGLRWAFTTTDLGFYAPMTCLSHMADASLFGLQPWGHHLTSIVLHAAAAIFLFLSLSRMTGARGPSFLVATLFAIHPLHVEPVAWIAERKEVLCGFFWAAALFAYARYAPRPSAVRYATVLAVFLLALLSKPMAVTFPFVLLLLDFWPLGRWPQAPAGTGRRASVRILLLEKAPMLLAALGMSLVTIGTQTEIGALRAAETFPASERITNALYSYAIYLSDTIAPTHLAALYPFEHGSMAIWKPLVGALVLVLGSAAALAVWRARPYVPVGWLWFCGTLVPVIGLVHVGSQARADRYTYLPLVGIFIVVAWCGASWLAGAARRFRLAALAITVFAVLALAIAARAQVATWRNDETLYARILEVSPRSVLANFNLGNHYLYEKSDPDRARQLYERALEIDPRYGDVHLNLGIALGRLGKSEDAKTQFREAVRLKPSLAEGHLDLALALAQEHRFADAEPELQAYLRLRPDDAATHQRLGMVRGELGDWKGAVDSLRAAAELRPGDAQIHALLGFAFLQSGNRQEAKRELEQSLKLAPDAPQSHFYLASMALDEGDRATATSHLEALRRTDPRLARVLEERIAGEAAVARPR